MIDGDGGIHEIDFELELIFSCMVFIKLDSSKELSSKNTTHTTGMLPSKR